MSGRMSYVTLKCEKPAITVLRYMFGSVYIMSAPTRMSPCIFESKCISESKLNNHNIYFLLIFIYLFVLQVNMTQPTEFW